MKPLSITYLMPLRVIEVSAIFVAMTTFRSTFGFVSVKAASYNSEGRAEYSGQIFNYGISLGNLFIFDLNP